MKRCHLSFVDNDHMIETLTADGANKAFNIRGLPGRPESGKNLLDQRVGRQRPESAAINAVTIPMRGKIASAPAVLAQGSCPRPSATTLPCGGRRCSVGNVMVPAAFQIPLHLFDMASVVRHEIPVE